MHDSSSNAHWAEPAAADKGWLRSLETGQRYAMGPLFACPATGGELSVEVDLEAAAESFAQDWNQAGSIWKRFSAVLAPFNADRAVSLGEGSTPLVRSERLARELGLRNLFFKLEGSNPTGSFKDRQMSVALSMGRLWGKTLYATISSGNVGNALSAYCAKAGAEAHVWVAENTAEAKLRQIAVYGAQLYHIPAPGPGKMRAYWELFAGMRAFCEANGAMPMVSARPVNPFMVEGTKTIAFELAAELGSVPDEVFCCVGGGGLLGGVTKGFKELREMGLADRLPRMTGAQRSDQEHAPINRLHEEPYVSGDYYLPLDGDWAAESIAETEGQLDLVTDTDILEAQALLAEREGIFAEPQGAYAAAALLKASRETRIDPDATVVCTITGTGLKDMAATARFGEVVTPKRIIQAQNLNDATFAGASAN
ncbi:pyridoxal-phosphate dependent enzyme [Palleronia sp. LCG004]|uniref:pyridoxal-phosphate dependent enzyme n=1 Tax=Palleronia sp. LCG004 TaxID=3079304 RepID=UPI00294342C3|nr:pyridoxal-phosphate dependent enzyme [Palleronia sp. LCG004]WOI57485.1 pyridoxal-phosphate dependent enzyme [Palleronia sp. LCG004]